MKHYTSARPITVDEKQCALRAKAIEVDMARLMVRWALSGEDDRLGELERMTKRHTELLVKAGEAYEVEAGRKDRGGTIIGDAHLLIKDWAMSRYMLGFYGAAEGTADRKIHGADRLGNNRRGEEWRARMFESTKEVHAARLVAMKAMAPLVEEELARLDREPKWDNRDPDLHADV